MSVLNSLLGRKLDDSPPSLGPQLASIAVSAIRTATLAKLGEFGEGTIANANALATHIEHAPKYVVSMPALQIAQDIGPQFNLRPVGEHCWVEFFIPIERQIDPPLALVGLYLTDVPAVLDKDCFAGRLFINRQEDARTLLTYGLRTLPDGSTELGVGIDEQQASRSMAGELLGLIATVLELIRHPRAVHKEHVPASTRRVRQRFRGDPKHKHVDAYTQVTIHITHDEDEDDCERTTGRTGIRKRFHHVRPFARTRLGKTELVVGHWRGDPKLGVVQARSYKVVP